MSVVHLREWTATAIEIALDLEIPTVNDRWLLGLSGLAKPRISLVVAFASTPQLKRICSAIARSTPAKPPAGLRITPVRSRRLRSGNAVAIHPMVALLRLQSKFIRSIEPGLVAGVPLAYGKSQAMDEAAMLFVRDYVPFKTLPAFEPRCVSEALEPTPIRATGLSVYRLGLQAAPESILAHWNYTDAKEYARDREVHS